MVSAATSRAEDGRAQAWRLALADIKIAHSVFAMPFALLGACLASPALGGPTAGPPGPAPWGAFAGQLALVVACMVFARTWAMLFNRIADRRFDAANPRTAGRALASGRLLLRHAVVYAAVAAGGFLACCAAFFLLFGNPWPTILALPTLGWIALYSLTKRFTPLSHFFLGSALALSPLAAALAVNPGALARTPALWGLAAMTLLWVAGFDILYAMQDEAFDRATGLRSIPARMGARRAAWLSRALHALAFACLLGAWRVEPRFGWLFLAGVAAVGFLLITEHAALAKRGLPGLPLAFGLINGVVSVLLGLCGIADLLVP